MSRKLAIFGVLFLVSSTIGGVVDIRDRLEANINREDSKGKEPEKKPNIVKDYVCLRDGELCHPNFAQNRGLYVSCSNGVAWEQQCPRCSYHPLTCPTRSLWFDGEKCEWASPKLASQPCIDRFPAFDLHNGTTGVEREAAMSEQDSLLHSLQNPMKEHMPEKSKWSNNPSPSMYFKSPKSGEFDNDASQEIDYQPKKEVKEAGEELEEASEADQDAAVKNKALRRKSADSAEPDFPNYLSADDGALGSKIVKLSEPVYALVNSPDGSGKQVLMRVFQPFVFEDGARNLLPTNDFVNSYEK